MMDQNEIKTSRPLLDSRGHITEEGWARSPYWQYERSKIKAPWFRIKEWDYYIILSQDMKKGVSFTISDLGYSGLMAICWIDMEKGIFSQADTLAVLPMGKITSDENRMEFQDKTLSLRYEIDGTKRKIAFEAPGLEIPGEGKGLHGELTLEQDPGLESMNIATSWSENRKRFYYNRKINCMPAEGYAATQHNRYEFNSSRDMATLDWGRGAWTYRNRWYWGSAGGYLDGVPFGFNIGYGFTDRTPASENMLFYKGIAHKLEEVSFLIDERDYMAPWKFTSSDGRFELDFKPVLDRQSEVNLLLIRSVQHQVFGYFSGTVILDSGEKLELKEFPGFAEDVYNRY